jgi:hypothetical protein
MTWGKIINILIEFKFMIMPPANALFNSNPMQGTKQNVMGSTYPLLASTKIQAVITHKDYM